MTVMEGVSLMGCVHRCVVGIVVVTSSVSALRFRQDEGGRKGGQGRKGATSSSCRHQDEARKTSGRFGERDLVDVTSLSSRRVIVAVSLLRPS